jgi:endonuclease/exonuclease/phosphatase family metal-dependent hydrolase
VVGRVPARRVGRVVLGIVAAALGAALLVTALRGRPSVSHKKPLAVCVATYNINVANEDLALVADAIIESQAEIVALQEVSPPAEAFLRERLASDYPSMAFEKSAGPWVTAQFGFISKHPIVRSRSVEPGPGLFGTQIAVVDLGGRTVQLANVHLNPLDANMRRTAGGLVRAALAAEETHLAEIERIYASLEPGIPAILLGDFNSLSFFKGPAFLRDRGFVDSFAAVQAEANMHPTWQWTTSYGTVSARIDYIFHDGSFRTLESRIIDRSSSDHRLVVSRLSFVEPLD